MNVNTEKMDFKEVFKYYKSKNSPPSLSDVVDFHVLKEKTEYVPGTLEINEDYKSLGLKDIKLWKIYTLKENLGLLYIPNPFTPKGQRYWIQRSLEEYPKMPNKTNIDNEIQIKDWWRLCHEKSESSKKYLKKLRWTTLGYHHDWNTKVYTEDNHNNFPDDLFRLCSVIARYIGEEKFLPQAAIVNYYHMDSTLSPHTDHSEVNLDAPLVSISFGQSAIFLIGGRDISQKPTALRLHSGDIVIMSKESRLSYHAVPKILPADFSPWNEDIEDTSESCSKYCKNNNTKDVSMKRYDNKNKWEPFESYIKYSRININVRQVLYTNQKNLTDSIVLL